MKTYLSSSIFSIFVSNLFPPVNMNMHSCPVKSALLPLRLLEYGVMQCHVIRPKLCPRRICFKSPSMWKILCCEFRREGWVLKNCPSKLCAGLKFARKCVSWKYHGWSTLIYSSCEMKSKKKIIQDYCCWNALLSSKARRSQEKHLSTCKL